MFSDSVEAGTAGFGLPKSGRLRRSPRAFRSEGHEPLDVLARAEEAGRELPALFREIGIADPGIDAHVIALKPGHPYLRLPLQFSVSLERPLLQTVSADELGSLRRAAEVELADPARWGTTFTVVQSWGKVEGGS
jgi:hypothetical protein